ncbi:MAG: SDR family NAD(P)-dependent oxidoreductase [Cyanobacteria bacterium SZAS TMP-1]|nr:SDR family NAD(P)-dependent oxidoreductase [Cyanobacteria bacterium SZAS TMP-1]
MRWAIVTGSSTGIGEAIVLRLLQEKVNVIAGIRKPEDAEKLKEKAQNYSAQLVTVELDVTSDEQIPAAFEKTRELLAGEGLWALVNNAGIVVAGPVETLSRDDWRRQFEVNFFWYDRNESGVPSPSPAGSCFSGWRCASHHARQLYRWARAATDDFRLYMQ